MELTSSSSVYIEGDIETRVYNDSINGDIKSIPEICVRRDGMWIWISIAYQLKIKYMLLLQSSN